MTYLQNPITGQVIAERSRKASANYLRYGWRKLSKAEHDQIKREYLIYLVKRRLAGVKLRLQ